MQLLVGSSSRFGGVFVLLGDLGNTFLAASVKSGMVDLMKLLMWLNSICGVRVCWFKFFVVLSFVIAIHSAIWDHLGLHRWQATLGMPRFCWKFGKVECGQITILHHTVNRAHG